ncbi:Sentrin-specific protease 7, partial [Pseudolycoriella hygida]
RIKIELVPKQPQSGVVERNVSAARGRGAMSARRGATSAVRGGRGRPKQKVPEPVTLLISDDEEEEKNEISDIIAYAEPTPEELNVLSPADFVRRKITDYHNAVDKIFTSFAVKIVNIGSYTFEPKEKVVISSIGIRIIAPNTKRQNENVILDIQKSEIVKIACHLNSPMNILFIWTSRSCGMFVRESLDMIKTGDNFFDPMSTNDHIKRIILQIDNLSEEAKATIRTIFSYEIIDEISQGDATRLLEKSTRSKKVVKIDSTDTNSCGVRNILIYPPPPVSRGIPINTEDYECLATDQYLNDVIIDFYLRYLQESFTPEQKARTHIFSTFFYKRLTENCPKDRTLTIAERRHKMVANWTKNVNIFEKDFIVIPINEQQHWFLVMICFPNQRGRVDYDTEIPMERISGVDVNKIIRLDSQQKFPKVYGNTTITPVSKREEESIYLGDDSEKEEADYDSSDVNSNPEYDEDDEFPSSQRMKKPCFLIFDSLSGAGRSKLMNILRGYLTCEYRRKFGESNGRTFDSDNFPHINVDVPQQDNFVDCGVYLLQYVEKFFKDPITDFRTKKMNLKLQNWFPAIEVTRKREEIAKLLQRLVVEHRPDDPPLPELTFPTLDGIVVASPNDMDNFGEEETLDDEYDD